jgi:hyperosmotically inducible protein
MNRLVWTLALILALMGGLVPIAMAQDRTLGQKVDDATLTTAVKTKLVADRARNLVKVNVDTHQGVVHLKGTVPSEEDKIEAERLARRTAGVRDVINELTVEAGSASPRTR